MKSGKPSTRKDKFIIIATVIAIFIVAGVIVVVIRAYGGDEPAPSSLTSADSPAATTATRPTSTATSTETAATQPTDIGSPATSGIRDVDWKAEIGVQPPVKDVENVIYADLTGDGSEEALVLVRTAGSGAYLDYYVFTLRNGAPALLFKKLDVQAGKVALGAQPSSFVETVPVFGPGDPNCCPGSLKKTTYTWAASAQVFAESGVETVPNPQ